MKTQNVNKPKIQKLAYNARLALREKLEDKVAVLSPVTNANRCRQLIGQLNRLDKKIAEYETNFRDTLTGEKE